MTEYIPKVSIGMPVYNGERWICEALDSLLGQTFDDFELIISDNASTDRTAELCRDYAASDARIRYLRNPENYGAARNFNLVFAQGTGRYFKWASYDDICEPEYLEKCVAVLDADPSIVNCYPRTKCIDEQGRYLFDYENGFQYVDHQRPSMRFADVVLKRHWVFEIWGVVRRETLAQTPLIESFAGSDYNLLAELALHGRFHEVPEYLFYQRRRRKERNFQTRQAWAEWFDTSKAGQVVFPDWCMLKAFVMSAFRVPVGPVETMRCHLVAAKWMLANWEGLYADIEVAIKRYVASMGRNVGDECKD